MTNPFDLTTNELRRRFFGLLTLTDVADILGVTAGRLARLAYHAENDYITFDVPKRRGGHRTIATPPDDLKIIQTRLNYVLYRVYRRKRGTHGFTVARSIVTNAREHCGKNWVLNIDLKDFFPSLHFGRVRGVFMGVPYRLPSQVATLLARLACFDGHLPQGAPTSPIISNMICRQLDAELHRLSRRYRCTYTRYADDITFSTQARDFPPEIASVGYSTSGAGLQLGADLTSILATAGFRVNQDKSRLQFRSQRQEVTGLRVNRFPNTSRRFYQRTRAMIHAWEKYGLEAAQAMYTRRFDIKYKTTGLKPSSFPQVVRGQLEFIRMVKGDGDTGLRTLSNRLNRLDSKLIQAFPPNVPSEPDERWSHLFQRYSPMVYLLEMRANGDVSQGTAFAWGRRFLATAGHCTEGLISVTSPIGEDFEFRSEATLRYESENVFGEMQVDRQRDVACLVLPEEASVGLWPVRSLPLNPGEQVAAIGYPTVPMREPTVGIYVGRVESRAAHFGGQIASVQVSIEMAGGLSGAPVIDRSGYLVGIVTEHTMERAAAGTSQRAFHHIVPIEYLHGLTRGR